jgi:hypothetical protein
MDADQNQNSNPQELQLTKDESQRSPRKERAKNPFTGIDDTLYEKYKLEMKASHGREWNHHEITELCKLEEFKMFLHQKTKMMEKIVFGETSIFDLIGSETPEPEIELDTPLRSSEKPRKGSGMRKPKVAAKIKDVLKLANPEKNSNTMICDMNWSYSLPYMVSASYANTDPRDDAYDDYPGKVLLWNTNFDLRPEFTCLAKSRVTKTCFDQFQSSVIYGGLGCGKISVWDVRAQRTAVQSVNPSPETHCTPIYG